MNLLAHKTTSININWDNRYSILIHIYILFFITPIEFIAKSLRIQLYESA